MPAFRILLACLIAAFTLAAAPAPDPAQPIQDFAKALQALPAPLTQPPVAAAVAAVFDLPGIAATTLDGRAATPDQTARLQRITANRLARDILEEQTATAPQWAVSETRTLDRGGWLVTTVARVTPDADPETLQWRIVETPEGLRIADVLKGGASYVARLERVLERALQVRSLDDVLAGMEEEYGLAPP